MGRILIVAELSESRSVLASAIARGPHTVHVIAPGELRIDFAREWDPDVILMDMAPDGMSLSIRISLLRDPELSRVPFVAFGDSEDEARALGASAWVSAPPPMERLLQLLAQFAAMRMPLS